MHLKNLNYKHSRFLSKIYYRNRIVLNLNKSPAVVIPPEPPSQRKGAAKAGAVRVSTAKGGKRPALDGIASQSGGISAKRSERILGNPPGGLEQNA